MNYEVEIQKVDRDLSLFEKLADSVSSNDERMRLLTRIALDILRSLQLKTAGSPGSYRIIAIDTTKERDNVEYPYPGNIIIVLNPADVSGDVYLRLNDGTADRINIAEQKQIGGSFDKFYITNSVGTGTLNIIVSKMPNFYVIPYQEVTVPALENITNVLMTSLADKDMLRYDSAAVKWINLTRAALLALLSGQASAAFDFNAQAITNVGNVDGVDVSAHASRHQDAGADEISVASLSGELADRQKSKVGSSALGWTLNKLLQGAGVGSDPTEVDVSGVFTELAGGQDKQATNATTWEDYDLSAIIGSGAKSVLVGIANVNTTSQRNGGARKNGSALGRILTLDKQDTGAGRYDTVVLTECDTNRVIEIYAQVAAEIYFNILGFFT